MSLGYETVQELQNAPPAGAWAAIFDCAWDICRQPIDEGRAAAEVARRDRAIGDFDQYLATAGWDLWRDYEASVPLASDTLAGWWAAQPAGRAVLILDGLSLREVPWLLAGAAKHGFLVHNSAVNGAELPADTSPFAKSLGFAQRSALGNNCAGGSHKLAAARTECSDIPWEDCAALVGSEPRWVFWHHWPDCRFEHHGDPGKGLSSLTEEVVAHLKSGGFWKLASRLAEGRRLVVTSDHGYAASGLFPDSDKEQTEYLRATFKSGRCNGSAQEPGPWTPPLDLLVDSRHGSNLFVNGRRKWKSTGGYPTITHGGLSILEVAVPWIELTKGGE